MFVAPIRGGDSTAGTLVGVMRLRDLIDTVVEPELRRGFSVTVYEGPFQVFGPVWAQSGDQGQWARDAVSRVDLLELRVQVWPSEELAERMKSTAPMAVLILGYLLALIVTVIAYVLLPPIGGRRAAGPAGEEAAGMAALAAGAETGGEDPAPAPAGDPERPSA